MTPVVQFVVGLLIALPFAAAQDGQDDLLDPIRATLEEASEAQGRGDGQAATALAAEGIELGLALDPEHGRADVAELVLPLGQIAYALQDMPATTKAYGYLVEHYTKTVGDEHHLTLAASTTLAISLKMQGSFEQAQAIERRLLDVCVRLHDEDSEEVLRARGNLAGTMAMQRDLVGARVVFERMLATLERTRPPLDQQLIVTRHNLALILTGLGDWEAALPVLEDVLASEIARGAPDGPQLWNIKTNLGGSLSLVGRHRESRAMLEDVLDKSRGVLPDDHDLRLNALSNLASNAEALGELAAARRIRDRVLAGFERSLPADHPTVLRTRINYAMNLFQSGDVPGARALTEGVVEHWERTLPADHPDLMRGHAFLAIVLGAAGEFGDSIPILEGVFASRRETLGEDHGLTVAAGFALGLALFKTGETEAGVELLEDVYAHIEERDSLEGLIASGSFATVVWMTGDRERAREIREAVHASAETLLDAGDVPLIDARHELARVLGELGEEAALIELAPKLAASLHVALKQVHGVSRREAAERLEHLDAALSTLLAIGGLANPDAPLVREGFALVESLRSRSAAPVAQDVQRRWPELVEFFGRVAELRGHLGATAGGADSAAGVTELSFELAEAERELQRELAQRGVEPTVVDVDGVARALPEGARAIGYREYDNDGVPSLLAHVVAPDRTVARVELGPLEPIERAVGNWRDALGRPVAARGDAVAGRTRKPSDPAGRELDTGRRLRELVLDPVLAAAGDADVLHVCLDGPLLLAPLDALPLADGRLGDERTLRQEVSFARLVAPRGPGAAPSGEDRMLLVGGIDYGSAPDAALQGATRAVALPLMDLPGTAEEIRAIGELYDRTFEREPVLLERDAATKERLAELMRGARFVHLATHGWFAPESVRSILDEASDDRAWRRLSLAETVTGFAPMTLCGLALAGANGGRDELGRAPGILTAEELSTYDLSSCELAVLSACETNVGIRRAGQGIQSLQAALHAAGARTSITSLWEVDDDATHELMERFYTNLWVEDLSGHEALWKAKVALREAGYPTRDWAGWVITGDTKSR